MTIRSAILGDEIDIQSMIIRCVDPENNPDFNEEGAKNFVKPNELSAIAQRIQNDEYLTLCYIKECKIVGLIGMQHYEKIDQLFVDPSARKMNISGKLWNAAKEICFEMGSNGHFWVKSSTMAVPVYQSFGFKLTSGQQRSNGIVFYSMVLD